MSIASEITRIQGNIADAYTEANAKGATMPATQDSDHLAATIATISTGVTPTGTKTITTNGTHDVTNYATANVNVPTTAPAHYIEKTVDANGKLVSASTVINLNGVTSLDSYALAYAYYQNGTVTGNVDWSTLTTISQYSLMSCFSKSSSITSIDLSSVTTVMYNGLLNVFREATGIVSVDLSSLETVGSYGLNYAFYGCSNLTSADLSSLETVDQYGLAYAFTGTKITNVNLQSLRNIAGTYAFQYCFTNCKSLTSVDMSGLETIPGSRQNTFDNCFSSDTALTSVDVSSLRQVLSYGGFQYCFKGCTSLPSIRFDSLESIQGQQAFQYCFQGCTSLQVIEFPSLTSTGVTTVSNMVDGCTNLITIKIPVMKNITSLGSLCSNSRIKYMKFESVETIGASGLSWTFYRCTSLTTVSFYALNPNSFGTYTNQFNSMLNGCTGVTVHFPMSIQSTISSWADVVAGFGGTNTTVLFDIVTSLTGADTNTYTRQEKDSTATATAWVYNDVLYYTSGTTEPAVNDTIYSDAACTTAVTTISAIA